MRFIQTMLLTSISFFLFIQPALSVTFSEHDLLFPKETKRDVLLSAIGDILINDRAYFDAQIAPNVFDFNPAFEEVQDELKRADFTIANAETLIGGVQYGLSTYPRFNGPVEIAHTLKQVGVDLVTMANNHVFDRGEHVLHHSLQYWNKLNIDTVGAYQNNEERKQIIVKNINDISFAFLAYTFSTNGLSLSPHSRFGVHTLSNHKNISHDIARAKQLADVVVVCPHFGTEYVKMPDATQQKWVQFFADEGAHIVVGTHPHVLQPPTFIRGKNGNETYVMYSLGNFFSGHHGVACQTGGIFFVHVTKTLHTNGNFIISIHDPSVFLTYVARRGNRQYKLYPLQHVPTSLLQNRDAVYENVRKQMRTYIHLPVK